VIHSGPLHVASVEVMTNNKHGRVGVLHFFFLKWIKGVVVPYTTNEENPPPSPKPTLRVKNSWVT
jgi:hypothetical protein